MRKPYDFKMVLRRTNLVLLNSVQKPMKKRRRSSVPIICTPLLIEERVYCGTMMMGLHKLIIGSPLKNRVGNNTCIKRAGLISVSRASVTMRVGCGWHLLVLVETSEALCFARCSDDGQVYFLQMTWCPAVVRVFQPVDWHMRHGPQEHQWLGIVSSAPFT